MSTKILFLKTSLYLTIVLVSKNSNNNRTIAITEAENGIRNHLGSVIKELHEIFP